MRNEVGMTLVELVVVLGLALAIAAMTVAYSMPWMVKESVRSAAFDVNGMLQLAKVEAVSRNRPSRFVVDTVAGELQVWDGLGSDTISDDVLLHDRTIPTHVLFARPDTGSAVTLDAVDAVSYQAVFRSDGMLDSGPGVVCLNSGNSFGSVSVYGAGGTEIFRWNGTGWASGF